MSGTVEITTPQAVRLFDELRVVGSRVLHDGDGLAEWTFPGGVRLTLAADESWHLGVAHDDEQEDG